MKNIECANKVGWLEEVEPFSKKETELISDMNQELWGLWHGATEQETDALNCPSKRNAPIVGVAVDE